MFDQQLHCPTFLGHHYMHSNTPQLSVKYQMLNSFSFNSKSFNSNSIIFLPTFQKFIGIDKFQFFLNWPQPWCSTVVIRGLSMWNYVSIYYSKLKVPLSYPLVYYANGFLGCLWLWSNCYILSLVVVQNLVCVALFQKTNRTLMLRWNDTSRYTEEFNGPGEPLQLSGWLGLYGPLRPSGLQDNCSRQNHLGYQYLNGRSGLLGLLRPKWSVRTSWLVRTCWSVRTT